MNQNPFTPPTLDDSGVASIRKRSKRAYFWASLLATVFFVFATVSAWIYFEATFSDGNIQVFDPTARIYEDPFEGSYLAYDSLYTINVSGFLVLTLILWTAVLLLTNMIVFLVRRILFVDRKPRLQKAN